MINRRKFLLGASVASLMISSPSVAWIHGFAGPSGTAIINGFNSVNSGEYPYKNFALGTPFISNKSGTFAFPAVLDPNGYPTSASALTDDLFCGNIPVPTAWAGNWVIGWSGKGKFILNNPNGFTVIQGGSFVTTGAGFSAGGVTTTSGTNGRIVISLGAGTPQTSFPFYFATKTASAFNGTLTGFYLCRDNGLTPGGASPNGGDEADILSGDMTKMFNNDFISALTTLNPYALRVMDFCNTNNSNVAQPYTLRRPVASFSYGSTVTSGVGSHFPPTCWAGAIGGTVDALTCGPAPSTPGVWTNGETFQGQNTVGANTVYTFNSAADNGSGLIRLALASTAGLTTGQKIALGFGSGFNSAIRGNWIITVVDGTHIDLTTNLKTGQPSAFNASFPPGSGQFSTATINVNGRGAKLLIWGARGGGGSLSSGGQTSLNAINTFSYDADFDAVYISPESTAVGITNGPPVEVIVALANKVNAGLWYCIPCSAIDSEITAMAAYVSANLRSTSPAFFEWSNEVWNTGFGSTGLAINKGLTLGIPEGSNQNWMSYYGLRCAQSMKLVNTAMPRARKVMAVQAQGGTGTSQAPNIYRLQGADLTTTNAVYAGTASGYNGPSISGGISYNVAPNRPIDLCTDLAYATYYSGAQCAGAAQDASYTSLSGISGSTNLLGQAANYATGNPALQAAALSFVDGDIRAGTLNGVAGTETLLALASGYAGGGPSGEYPGWENIATSYDISRTSSGIPLLQVSLYEGGCEIWPVSAAQLASLGDASSVVDAANVLALFTAYKNSALFKQLMLDQFSQFMNTAAINPSLVNHSRHPNWYQFGGGSQWSLYPGDLYSTPWQSFNAYQQFNGH